jgi:hypothetical protein
MLKDKELPGQEVGWEFGFLSDFLNGLTKRKARSKTPDAGFRQGRRKHN